MRDLRALRENPSRHVDSAIWDLANDYLQDRDHPDLTMEQQAMVVEEAVRLGWTFVQKEKVWTADGPGIVCAAFEHKWQSACEAVRVTSDFYFDECGAKVRWELDEEEEDGMISEADALEEEMRERAERDRSGQPTMRQRQQIRYEKKVRALEKKVDRMEMILRAHGLDDEPITEEE